MNFLEMDNLVQSAFCHFWVDDVEVRICEAADTINMPKSMGQGQGIMPQADNMKVWRVTYEVPAQQFTTNLTAQSVEEARYMVMQFLKDKVTNRGKTPLSAVLKQSVLQAARDAKIMEDPRSRSLDRGWPEKKPGQDQASITLPRWQGDQTQPIA